MIFSESFFRASGLAADFAAQSRLGIYVHVPFCPHICPYCDFVKTAKFRRTDVQSFFSALEKQWDDLQHRIPAHLTMATLYFGGGTPSLFPTSLYRPLVERIKSRFQIEEFTVETNPLTNAHGTFTSWAELGAQRVTLGAQSLNESVLKYLGRRHSRNDVLESIAAARAAGLEQVQVDLIFGIKSQVTERDIADEIQTLQSQGATGVSCYLLTIEEKTAFARESTAVDDDVIFEYQRICETCDQHGFIQYETSNFSLTPPIHNRLYWYGLPYLGLGTGAHGLLPGDKEAPFGLRYRVGQAPQRQASGDDHLPFARESENLFSLHFFEEKRTQALVLQELLFTLLRTRDGIPLRWLQLMYEHEALGRLWNDPRICRALSEKSLLLDKEHLFLPAEEKIRGDSWALLLSSLLHP